jgi:hypothetical protein
LNAPQYITGLALAAPASTTRETMTDIENALDGRSRIERELGRGGMDAVYLMAVAQPAMSVRLFYTGTKRGLRARMTTGNRRSALRSPDGDARCPLVPADAVDVFVHHGD